MSDSKENQKVLILKKRKREKELFEKYNPNDPQELKILQDSLLKLHSNIPDIVIRKNFPGSFFDKNIIEDLRQSGRIGVMIAVERYDKSHDSNCSFFNYACIWAKKLIYKCKENERVVKIPQYMSLLLNRKYKKMKEKEDEGFKTLQEMMSENIIPTKEIDAEIEYVDNKMSDNLFWGSFISDMENYEGLLPHDLEKALSYEDTLGEGENTDYSEVQGTFKGFLKDFFKNEKNIRNFGIFIDREVHRLSFRQIAEKYNIHHAQVSNIIKGKGRGNGETTKNFVEQLKHKLFKHMRANGQNPSEMDFESFKKIFLDECVKKG